MRSFESGLIRVVNSIETDVTCTTLLDKHYKVNDSKFFQNCFCFPFLVRKSSAKP